MTVVRHQRSPQKPPGSSLSFSRTGVQPSPDSPTIELPPPSLNLVRTHPIEHYQALRDSAPCLSRAATLPKGTKLGLGRGAHLGTPSSANHTAAASQPTGYREGSQLTASLEGEPSHTHTPKPGFGGRGHTSCDATRNARGNVCSCWMSIALAKGRHTGGLLFLVLSVSLRTMVIMRFLY